ncbi:MAG: D-aminoacylase [Terracidiphilus sp.]|jgi:N-acyl-D-amino-acid deacylase
MSNPNLIIRNAMVLDGSGAAATRADVSVENGQIVAVGPSLPGAAVNIVEANGLALAPGFIDVHTHDDLAVLARPATLPKISQGVTTVIVGNCGISAAPVTLRGNLPDPMNLLGKSEEFRYPTFGAYRRAVEDAQPAVNVAALIGHTALRSNHMDRLDREATSHEVAAMREQLEEALEAGALGLSTGLAYLSANAASKDEVLNLAAPLAAAGAIYATHMRTEGDRILDAMGEAFEIGRSSSVPVVISHLKCAGIANWGRSGEVLAALDAARHSQQTGCDCYPYAATSTILDLRQVDERVKITITWSTSHPEMAGKTLADIAAEWQTTQLEAARRLKPAGAIYHSISEDDMRTILRHPATMIGSDGLPNDLHPHPRLWGAFPRVLGRYCRDEALFALSEAIHKMTGLPAQRFSLAGRGFIRAGCAADMVLFDPNTIADAATFSDPIKPATGINAVWVNGTLTYTAEGATGNRAGRFLARGKPSWVQ